MPSSLIVAMDFGLSGWAILTIGAGVAGWVDAVIGGGGLVLIPLILAVAPQLAPATALATTAVAYVSYELVEVPGARVVRAALATRRGPATPGTPPRSTPQPAGA